MKELKELVVSFVVVLTLIFLLMLIGTGAGWWGLWFQRTAAPFAEETRRITYGQSLTYQQGAQHDFEDLCLQYSKASDETSKSMIKDVIIRRKQDYVGPALSEDVTNCFVRIGVQ